MDQRTSRQLQGAVEIIGGVVLLTVSIAWAVVVILLSAIRR